jgi:hypothetical protein
VRHYYFFNLANNFGSLDSYCHTQQRKGRSTLHVVQTKEHQVIKLTSFPETGNFGFHMFTVFEAKIKNSDFLHRSMLSGLGYQKTHQMTLKNSHIGRCTLKTPRFLVFFPFFKSAPLKFLTDLAKNL